MAICDGPLTMRLGYFGGSFDPPHCGHLAIAQAAAQQFSLDRVWMAPTGRQPLKRRGADASFSDRLAMTRLLCEQDDRLIASEIDAPRPDRGPNYTSDALVRVHEQAPGAAVFAIVGADALPDLPHWHEAERLFALATWIAVSRPGHPFSERLPAALQVEVDRGRLCLVHEIEVPVSSTEIRQSLRDSADLTREQLPESVLRYIRAHRLYSERLGKSLPLGSGSRS